MPRIDCSLRIEYAYWLLAAFFFAAAWMNTRERRWAAATFWAMLGVLFAGGDWALVAQKAGDARPVQGAGSASSHWPCSPH